VTSARGRRLLTYAAVAAAVVALVLGLPLALIHSGGHSRGVTTVRLP
jgi:ABC-type sulfate transport system permease component